MIIYGCVAADTQEDEYPTAIHLQTHLRSSLELPTERNFISVSDISGRMSRAPLLAPFRCVQVKGTRRNRRHEIRSRSQSPLSMVLVVVGIPVTCWIADND